MQSSRPTDGTQRPCKASWPPWSLLPSFCSASDRLRMLKGLCFPGDKSSCQSSKDPSSTRVPGSAETSCPLSGLIGNSQPRLLGECLFALALSSAWDHTRLRGVFNQPRPGVYTRVVGLTRDNSKQCVLWEGKIRGHGQGLRMDQDWGWT